MSNNPIGIPNITINGSDYWETHKSEYNALIGNPVGTFKIDLSSYNTASDTLYAWTTTGCYDINDTTKPLTVYTLSETPVVNDKTYDSNGDEFDGRCWTGAEGGTVPNNINEVTSTTITLGIPTPTPIL